MRKKRVEYLLILFDNLNNSFLLFSLPSTSLPFSFFLPPLTLFCISLSLFMHTLHNNRNALSSLSLTVFGFVYIALPLSWGIDIHFSSTFWLVWLLITVKGSDISAYIVGKCFGKHLLAPTVSPKKTIEGALASILGAALLSLLLSPFSPTPLPLKSFFSLGGSIGALSILGDLSESLIKRDANVKDSSTIPGLGGALDAIDSLLFATPCLYFYLKINHLL